MHKHRRRATFFVHVPLDKKRAWPCTHAQTLRESVSPAMGFATWMPLMLILSHTRTFTNIEEINLCCCRPRKVASTPPKSSPRTPKAAPRPPQDCPRASNHPKTTPRPARRRPTLPQEPRLDGRAHGPRNDSTCPAARTHTTLPWSAKLPGRNSVRAVPTSAACRPSSCTPTGKSAMSSTAVPVSAAVLAIEWLPGSRPPSCGTLLQSSFSRRRWSRHSATVRCSGQPSLSWEEKPRYESGT